MASINICGSLILRTAMKMQSTQGAKNISGLKNKTKTLAGRQDIGEPSWNPTALLSKKKSHGSFSPAHTTGNSAAATPRL